MQTLPIARQLAVLALIVGSATTAHAFSLSTSGNLTYNDDVADVAFTLASSTAAVRLWTTSFNSGVNFDPVLTLWKRAGSDYTLVSGADDDSSIGPGQTSYDAGLRFGSLDAGHYLASITASPYLAAGTLYSQGFAFANSAIERTLISQWNQPGSDNNQKGTFWSLNVATGAVPEPDLSVLLALGLSVLGWMSYRSRRA
jgi:hypothetical protein